MIIIRHSLRFKINLELSHDLNFFNFLFEEVSFRSNRNLHGKQSNGIINFKLTLSIRLLNEIKRYYINCIHDFNAGTPCFGIYLMKTCDNFHVVKGTEWIKSFRLN